MSETPPDLSATTAPTQSLDSTILHVLMDTIPDRIYFKDLQSRFVRNNLAQARSLGAASPEDCVGKTDYDYFSREHADQAFIDEQVIIRTGRPIIANWWAVDALTGDHTRQYHIFFHDGAALMAENGRKEPFGISA